MLSAVLMEPVRLFGAITTTLHLKCKTVAARTLRLPPRCPQKENLPKEGVIFCLFVSDC